MNNEIIDEMNNAFQTAFIDSTNPSNLALKPQFVSNNYKEGKKVLSSIEDELLSCDHFRISVAFITMSGITPLLMTFKELEKRGIKGEILTTDYLSFSDPKALNKLHSLSNLTVRMFDTEAAGEGFHTKGYIFRKDDIYRIIIGSSNMTLAALTKNHEWNTRIVSTENGETAKQINEEFDMLWNSEYTKEYSCFIDDYSIQYYKNSIIRNQKAMARYENIISLDRHRLKPNSMQSGFISNLSKIVDSGKDRALLISATGTGKTYASAFAMRELGFKRVLFVVHRNQLTMQTLRSYQMVFGNNISTGIMGDGKYDYDSDYIFANVFTICREEHLKKFKPTDFDCIILDEAHHSTAKSFQKLMDYFKPSLWLGMTATPDKRDDGISDTNIYEIFDYQIAYEIRLQNAMEEELLCPFHYFGISDITLENEDVSAKISFDMLVNDERVKHIISQAEYYGYSGERVKGLVFCSTIKECEELSFKFNKCGFRTIALSSEKSTEEERTSAFERLAMNEKDADENHTPLDYIFSVNLLNEGIDIVEVNQIIMLRPTQSPIVFIQQLGRGLRKAEGKEYTVVLDFIGNYQNNFFIPVALSGDCSYNSDNIKKYMISGNNIIPGSSSIHFDEVSKDKIFKAVDKIKGIRSLIREEYISLKNRLGRIPYLCDFYDHRSIDTVLLIREYKTYFNFIGSMEKNDIVPRLSDYEKLVLEYLSKIIVSGIRPFEAEILSELTERKYIDDSFGAALSEKYENYDKSSFENAMEVLDGTFVNNENELNKFKKINIISFNSGKYSLSDRFQESLENEEFRKQIMDLCRASLLRNKEKYFSNEKFVLFEKYSRRDVCLLMNCGKDLSSVMYGMKRIGDDTFIFVTYHKVSAEDDKKQYADGKPDYADIFADNLLFRWDSQMGKGPESSYMKEVVTAKRRHLFVKKSDAETNFYYMGTMNIIHMEKAYKKDNKGKDREITKVTAKMDHPVRDDILRYLKSEI